MQAVFLLLGQQPYNSLFNTANFPRNIFDTGIFRAGFSMPLVFDAAEFLARYFSACRS